MKLFIGEVKKATGRTVREQYFEAMKPMTVKGEQIQFPQPVRLSITLMNGGSEILAEGMLQALAMISCSRCLEPYVCEVEGEVCLEFRNAELLSRPSHYEAEAQEDTDIRYYYEDDNYIDITREIREILLLNLPMKPLCREDCRGLCSFCGEDLNRSQCRCPGKTEDPRLSALKNWSQNEFIEKKGFQFK